MTSAAGRTKWRVFELAFVAALFAASLGSSGCGGDGTPAPDAGGGTGGGASGSGGTSARGGAGGTSGEGGRLTSPDAAGTGGTSGSGGAGGGSSPMQMDGGTTPLDGAGAETSAPDVPAIDAGACTACTRWAMPTMLGRVSAPGLDALSGMAASWRNSGIVYVHNDRDRAVIHALNESATLVATITLTGAMVRDVEDMAVSRCPGGTCLFLADIGNNVNPREEFAIYRATEPTLPIMAPPAPMQVSLAGERFAFRYADGAHNAESLIIDPNGGGVYIVTKVNAGMPSAAYRLMTFAAGQMNVAMKIADLPVPRANDTPATSGTAHPCGAGFLLRTGNTLYDFPIAAGTPFEQAFRATPVVLPVATEQQGEAVTYRADGRAIYTTSEGASPPLNRTLCQ
ncbi:MAG TPA: hypothetical protein VGF45_05410 [Polyangia bacterium]